MSPCVHGFPLLHFGGLLDLEQYLGKGVSEAGWQIEDLDGRK